MVRGVALVVVMCITIYSWCKKFVAHVNTTVSIVNQENHDEILLPVVVVAVLD